MATGSMLAYNAQRPFFQGQSLRWHTLPSDHPIYLISHSSHWKHDPNDPSWLCVRCYTYDELGNIWWHLPPGYINLEGDNGDGPPPAKRPDILTHMMNPVPKFNCAYAALDTSTPEEDEDDQEDAIDPDSCYSSALADSLVQEVKKFIGTTFWRSNLKQKRLEIPKPIPKTRHASHKGSTIRSWH